MKIDLTVTNIKIQGSQRVDAGWQKKRGKLNYENIMARNIFEGKNAESGGHHLNNPIVNF